MSTAIKYEGSIQKHSRKDHIFKAFKLQMMLLMELLKEILCLDKNKERNLKWNIDSMAFTDK